MSSKSSSMRTASDWKRPRTASDDSSMTGMKVSSGPTLAEMRLAREEILGHLLPNDRRAPEAHLVEMYAKGTGPDPA